MVRNFAAGNSISVELIIDQVNWNLIKVAFKIIIFFPKYLLDLFALVLRRTLCAVNDVYIHS